MTKIFKVFGMSCAVCQQKVEKSVKDVLGVSEVFVNLITAEMKVTFSEETSVDNIILAVEKAGYTAKLIDENNQKSQPISPLSQETKEIIKRLIPSFVLLIFLMYFSMRKMLGLYLPEFFNTNLGALTNALIQLSLCLAILIINRKFFINGFKALIKLSPNMDSLVALGSGASFIYSLAVTIKIAVYCQNGAFIQITQFLGDLYFEGSAMIVTLITLGKMLESLSKGKTTSAIQSLMALSPKTATLLVDGKEIVVDIESVKVGDIFVVKTGDSIPTDAVIIEGSASVDESTLTGEFVPVEKTINDQVFASTINLNGYFLAKATNVGNDTTLSKIIEMVKNVTLSKAPIAKTADKVAGIFVPSVIAIALAVFAIWLLIGESFAFSLQRCVAVLVISCPCALGLATPVAIMVGSGVGAKVGALFKTATSLEVLGKSNAVVLDKTGTITSGKPSVSDVIALNNYTEQELINIATLLETKSEHPLAKAITNSFGLNLEETDNFEVLSGLGVTATKNGERFVAGNLTLLKDYQINVESAEDIGKNLASQGKTPIYFAKNNEIVGVIAVFDTIKEESKFVIQSLQTLGIEVFMLTGDTSLSAKAVAKLCSIKEENVIAGVFPNQKQEIVKNLKEKYTVVMVGDGVNDAPSLSQADVGVAISSGSFIATDSAEVVLMNDLTSLLNAVLLSKKVIRTIKQNLFWAFIYNIICIPIAAGALSSLGINLSPMLAAAAMSLSSLFVVTNALRLNFYKKVRFEKCQNDKICSVSIDNFSPLVQNMQEDNSSSPTPLEEGEKDKTIEGSTLAPKTTVLQVDGMMCSHCEKHVTNAVLSVEGVVSCKASHEQKTCVIIHNNADLEKIKKAIESEDYIVLGEKE